MNDTLEIVLKARISEAEERPKEDAELYEYELAQLVAYAEKVRDLPARLGEVAAMRWSALRSKAKLRASLEALQLWHQWLSPVKLDGFGLDQAGLVKTLDTLVTGSFGQLIRELGNASAADTRSPKFREALADVWLTVPEPGPVDQYEDPGWVAPLLYKLLRPVGRQSCGRQSLAVSDWAFVKGRTLATFGEYARGHGNDIRLFGWCFSNHSRLLLQRVFYSGRLPVSVLRYASPEWLYSGDEPTPTWLSRGPDDWLDRDSDSTSTGVTIANFPAAWQEGLHREWARALKESYGQELTAEEWQQIQCGEMRYAPPERTWSRVDIEQRVLALILEGAFSWGKGRVAVVISDLSQWTDKGSIPGMEDVDCIRWMIDHDLLEAVIRLPGPPPPDPELGLPDHRPVRAILIATNDKAPDRAGKVLVADLSGRPEIDCESIVQLHRDFSPVPGVTHIVPTDVLQALRYNLMIGIEGAALLASLEPTTVSLGSVVTGFHDAATAAYYLNYTESSRDYMDEEELEQIDALVARQRALFSNDGVTLVTVGSLLRDNPVPYELGPIVEAEMPEQGLDSDPPKLTRVSVLFMDANPIEACVYRPGMFPTSEVYAWDGVNVLEPDETKILPEYLCYVLREDKGFRDQVEAVCNSQVEAGRCRCLRIPLPDLVEQKRILFDYREELVRREECRFETRVEQIVSNVYGVPDPELHQLFDAEVASDRVGAMAYHAICSVAGLTIDDARRQLFACTPVILKRNRHSLLSSVVNGAKASYSEASLYGYFYTPTTSPWNGSKFGPLPERLRDIATALGTEWAAAVAAKVGTDIEQVKCYASLFKGVEGEWWKHGNDILASWLGCPRSARVSFGKLLHRLGRLPGASMRINGQGVTLYVREHRVGRRRDCGHVELRDGDVAVLDFGGSDDPRRMFSELSSKGPRSRFVQITGDDPSDVEYVATVLEGTYRRFTMGTSDRGTFREHVWALSDMLRTSLEGDDFIDALVSLLAFRRTTASPLDPAGISPVAPWDVEPEVFGERYLEWFPENTSTDADIQLGIAFFDPQLTRDIHSRLEQVDFSAVSSDTVSEVFGELLVERRRDGAEWGTPLHLSKFCAMLARPRPGDVIYDPCIGLGGMAVAMRQHVEAAEGTQDLCLVGADVNAHTLWLCRQLFLLHGISDSQLHSLDTLEAPPPHQPVDVVVANPPFGMKHRPSVNEAERGGRLRSELAFLQRSLAALNKRDGRAVFLLPIAALSSPAPADRACRRCLIDGSDGFVIDAVFNLPGEALHKRGGFSFAVVVVKPTPTSTAGREIFIADIVDASSDRLEEIAQAYSERRKIPGVAALFAADRFSDAISVSVGLQSVQQRLRKDDQHFVPLATIATIQRGRISRRNMEKQGAPRIPVVTTEDLTTDGIGQELRAENLQTVAELSTRQTLDRPALFVPEIEGRHRHAVFIPSENTPRIAVGTSVVALVPRDESLSVEYLASQLSASAAVHAQLPHLTRGANIPRIDYRSLLIRVPDRETQAREIEAAKERLVLEVRARHRAEIQLLTAEREDVEAELMNAMTHNLRNKLGPLLMDLDVIKRVLQDQGLLTALVDEPEDEEDEVETIEAVLTRSQASASAIGDLVDDAKKVFGEEIPEEEFELVEISDVFRGFRHRHQHAEFTITVGRRRARLRIHRTALEEALENMLKNAQVHAWDDGIPERTFELDLVPEPARNQVQLIVRNSGRPFPDDMSEADYRRFARKAKSSSGSGVGGAWVDKFLKAHRGSLNIRRLGPTMGTEFIMTLPMEESQNG
ncbi:MAG: N-6 DNA methylase [Lentisphaerae bacterium]|nr:N-6 DNA methylase [Lentisphaerota bacterium]